MKKIIETLPSFIIYLLLIFSLAPFIILSFYAEPSLDDYSYASKLYTHSFLGAVKNEYMTWGSRYTATSILIANPIHLGDFLGYKLVSLFMIISFLGASLYFFSNVIQNRNTAFLITSCFCFLYFFMNPDITSSFFWLSGSATYQLANTLVLLFFTILSKAIKSRKSIHITILYILIFIIIGCNEISTVYLDIIIFLSFVYYYIENKKISGILLGLLVWAGLCTLFILTAPGNAARSEFASPNISLLESLILIVKKVCIIIIRYGIISFTITFFTFYQLKERIYKLNIDFLKYPLYYYLLSGLILIFLGTAPSIIILHENPPTRTIIVIFLGMLLSIMAINYKIIIFLKKFNFLEFPKYTSSIFIILITFGYTLGLNNKNILDFNNNLYWAYADILSGDAMKFKKEMKNRYNTISSSKEDIVYVEGLKHNPRTILIADLSTHPDYFYNIGMADFFHKKAIIKKK